MSNKTAIFSVMTVLTMASLSQAAVLVSYPFTGGTTTYLSSSLAPNVTATAVTGGTGVNITSSGGSYADAPFIVANRTTNTAAQNYFQFSISAASGYELDLSSFSIDMSAGGGNSGDRSVSLRTSVDGLNLTDAVFADQPLTSVRPNKTNYQYDLSASKYQDLSTFTVRVYFTTPGVSQNIDIDNIVVNGAVVAVPEPAMLGLAPVAAVGLLRRRR